MSTINAGWRGPNIVKEGLVLYLDAASGTSYSPYNSGTTWRDISGNNNNGILTNGPVYNTTNGGSFVFDGVNDYAIVPSLTWTPSAFTVFWFTLGNTRTDYNQGIGAVNGWGAFTFHTTVVGSLYVGIDLSTRLTPSTIPSNTYTLGVYQNFVFSYSAGSGSLYKNGMSIASKAMNAPGPWGGFSMGGNSINTINGNIPLVQIYNRALTPEEVLQNYNSTKGRFGL